jgi:hypothetical protein
MLYLYLLTSLEPVLAFEPHVLFTVAKYILSFNKFDNICKQEIISIFVTAKYEEDG